MPDRREGARNKSIHLCVAEIGEPGMSRDGGLRDIPADGPAVEPSHVVEFKKRLISPGTGPGTGSFLAKIIRWRDNFADVAFGPETPFEPPVSDLDERLRQSEQKKRQLQSRINALLSRD
jgi:hypothetical protein